MPDKQITVKTLYYRVVKMYELPVRNHLHINKKVQELEREIGSFRAKHYLATLLRRDLRTETGEYKPIMHDGLDPYIKRLKIEDYLIRYKPQKVYRPSSPEAAEREARRQKQWQD